MKQKINESLKKCFGVLLIALGIIGLFLPILQGILMIITGILLLSPKHGKTIVEYCKNCWKKVKKK